MIESRPLETQTGNSEESRGPGSARPVEIPALVVVWSRDEPERVGEVLLPDPALAPADGWIFGRGDEGEQRLRLVRQRPGHNLETAPIEAAQISRVQLRIAPGQADTLLIRNPGRLALLIDGQEVQRQRRVREGAVLELRKQMMLMVVHRPTLLPALELPDSLRPAFGRADAFGLVGESPPAWSLRGQILFAAEREVHVLVNGASGVGKELVAQAIHALSRRREQPLISRNAATFPDTLIDAELFGNARNYPNPGMPARPGLVGSADRSSLFLDEIGELSHELQAHLLRVLDQGEYQRLGDATPRRADLRMIAATNRAVHELKHDFAARLRLRVEVPDLVSRREDIALLIPHLVRRIASDDPMLAQRLFPSGDPAGHPRVEPRLVRHLLLHDYRTHVRELEGMLWTAMMHSLVEGHDRIRLFEEPVVREVEPGSLTTAQIEAALEQAEGVRDRAWRLLGLRNRFQLTRLLKKHGIDGG